MSSDADAVAASWNAEERPFDLVPASPETALAVVGETRVDAVVYHAEDSGEITTDDGRDGNELLQGIARGNHPVVVLATDGDEPAGGGMSAADAMAVGATYIDIQADFDAEARLADIVPLVDRYRESVRERTMLDSLLEHIPLSVYWKDRQSRHVHVSDAMLSLVGRDYIESPDGVRFHAPADVVGLSDWDLYSAELAESATEDDRRVMDTETPIVDRIERGFGSEGETYVATWKAPWYDVHGRVVGIVGISRDVTERMQYERQLERQNDRLEQFAQVISHDLRNPLSVARGRLDLLRAGEDVTENADAMDRAFDRMDALVSEVLTLAREGEVVADPEPVDLAAAATAAWDLVDASDATLVVEADGEILADGGRLQQVFENLFRNAVEHGTPNAERTPGAVEHGSTSDQHSAGATEHERSADGRELTIIVGALPGEGFYVEDDGDGVPRERREEVFEVGVTTSETGTGLGLGIVRSIAEAHGWKVELRESEGGGARFDFTGVRRPR